MTPIPESLMKTYRTWLEVGTPRQGRFLWRPKTWRRKFSSVSVGAQHSVDLGEAIETIAEVASKAPDGREDLIDRDLVRQLSTPDTLRGDSDSMDPQKVVTAFVAAMIWGYGTSGYGPYRTHRVLTTDPCAVENLVEVAHTAQGSKQGGEAAFEKIAEGRKSGGNFLKYLGPAFGTKFLYFLTAASSVAETTPVLDAVLRGWFRREAHETFYTTWWDTMSYGRYLRLLDEWRRQMPAGSRAASLTREDVELLIFATARGDAEGWLKYVELVRPEELGLDQLLDALENEVDQLATRPREDSQEGPSLLARLRRWTEQDDEVDA